MLSREELAREATPESVNAYTKRNAPQLRQTRHMHGHGEHGAAPMSSVRELTYNGHQITIRTTYEIQIDERPLEGHLAVTNDGRVHYHTLPNVSYGSAVDMVKVVIDAFPDDFPVPAAGGKGGKHGGHSPQHP